MAKDRPLALWIGDAARAEFAAVARQLAARFELVCAADSNAAEALAERLVRPPLLLIVASAWPGQFEDEPLTRLWNRWPLARLVSLAGSWCEGQLRSGRPSPGAIRCYWHQWSPRLERDWQAWQLGLAPSWSLPVTAGDDDRLLWNDRRWGAHRARSTLAAGAAQPRDGMHVVEEIDAAYAVDAVTGSPAAEVAVRRPRRRSSQQPQPRSGTAGGLVVVAARGADSAQWLLEVCRQLGLAAVWQMPHAPLVHSGAVLGIWDIEQALRPPADRPAEQAVFTQAGSEHRERGDGDPLARFCRAVAPARVLALAGFPRADDLARLTASGAAAVLSKPLAVADLAWQIERLVRGTAQS